MPRMNPLSCIAAHKFLQCRAAIVGGGGCSSILARHDAHSFSLVHVVFQRTDSTRKPSNPKYTPLPTIAIGAHSGEVTATKRPAVHMLHPNKPNTAIRPEVLVGKDWRAFVTAAGGFQKVPGQPARAKRTDRRPGTRALNYHPAPDAQLLHAAKDRLGVGELGAALYRPLRMQEPSCTGQGHSRLAWRAGMNNMVPPGACVRPRSSVQSRRRRRCPVHLSPCSGPRSSGFLIINLQGLGGAIGIPLCLTQKP